jgi:hypothetical protein
MASDGLGAFFACVGLWRFMTILLPDCLWLAAFHSVESVSYFQYEKA